MVCQIEIGNKNLTTANIFFRFHKQKKFRFFILPYRVQWRFSIKTTSFRKVPYKGRRDLIPFT